MTTKKTEAQAPAAEAETKPERKKPGRKPSPLTAAVNNFNKDKRRVESLNAQVVKIETRLNGVKGDLENAIQDLAKSRKELDSVLGDVIQ